LQLVLTSHFSSVFAQGANAFFKNIEFLPKGPTFSQGAKHFWGVFPSKKLEENPPARTGSAERDKSRRYDLIKLPKNSPLPYRRVVTQSCRGHTLRLAHYLKLARLNLKENLDTP
jgi:hypothetical protein